MLSVDGLTGNRGNQLCAEAIHDACVSEAQKLGFEWFLYGVRVPLAASRPYQFILSGYPREWRQHYDAQQYISIDPLVHHAMCSVLPMAWDEVSPQDDKVQQLFNEAGEAGLKHGLTIPVHGAKGEFSLLSLCGPDELPASDKARNELLVAAHSLAVQVHECVRTNILTAHMHQANSTLQLTRRERECLRWVACGLTNDEIAKQVGVSSRTVIFHLNNCAEKLGVRRKLDAAARAVELGLIEPVTYPTPISKSENLFEGVGHALRH